MFLFLCSLNIDRIPHYKHEDDSCNVECVVRARNAFDAREVAAKYAGSEGQNSWIDPDVCEVVEIGRPSDPTDKTRGLILMRHK